MPQPASRESDLPTAAPAPGGGLNIDDLERRLTDFASATQRLSRTIEATEAKAGEASGWHGAMARPEGSNEDISGLRPAAHAPGMTPGALTTRRPKDNQAASGFTSALGKPAVSASGLHATAPSTRRLREAATPGFTSVFGRPSIPPASSETRVVTEGVPAPSATRPRTPWRLAGAALVGALLLGTGALVVRPTSSSATVTSTSTRYKASIPGTVRLETTAGGAANRGDPLMLLRNDHPDRAGLEALRIRHLSLLARHASLRAELDLANRPPPVDNTTLAAAKERLDRLLSIERETADVGERLVSITSEIDRENERLAATAEQRITSNENGYVRRLLVTDGQRVAAEAELAELLDLDSLALEPQVTAGSVAPGALALIALGDGSCLKGTVVSVHSDGNTTRARVVPDRPSLLAPLSGQRLRVAFLAPDSGLTQRTGERLWRPLGW